MKHFSVLGSLGILFLPFAIIRANIGEHKVYSANLGVLYYQSDRFMGDNFSTISVNWFSGNGTYGVYFGEEMWYVGIIIIVGTVVGIFLALTRPAEVYSEFILAGVALLLLLVRSSRLESSHLAFFQRQRYGNITSVYYEVPLAPIFALLMAFAQLIRSKEEKK